METSAHEITLKEYLEVCIKSLETSIASEFTGLKADLVRLEISVHKRLDKAEDEATHDRTRIEVLEQKDVIWQTKMKIWGGFLTGIFAVISIVVSVLVRVFIP